MIFRRLAVACLALTIFQAKALGAPELLPVPNHSFEEDADRDGKPDGWDFGDYDYLAGLSDEARDGNKSFKIRCDRDTWAYNTLPLKYLPEGGDISVACWIKLVKLTIKDDDPNWMVFRIYVEIKDSAGNKREADVVKLDKPRDWKWYFSEKRISIPKDYEEAKLVVTFNGLAGEALIDRIVVVRGSELPPETITTAGQVGTKAEILKGAISRVRQAVRNKSLEQSPLEAATEARSRIDAAILLAAELEKEAAKFTPSTRAEEEKAAAMRSAVAELRTNVDRAMQSVRAAEEIHRTVKDFDKAERMGAERIGEALEFLRQAELAAETAEAAITESLALAASWGGGVFRAKRDDPHEWESANEENPFPFATFIKADDTGALYAGGVDDRLYDSQDNGRNWSTSPTMLPVTPSSFAVDAAGAGPSAPWYIASWGKSMWRSTDQGRNWTPIQDSPAFARGLLVQRGGDSKYKYFCIIDDASISGSARIEGPWNKIAGMPPGIKAWDLAQKPGDRDVLLAATDAGLAEITLKGDVTFPKLEVASANARSLATDGARVLIGTWGGGIVEWKPLSEETPRAIIINDGLENRSILALAISRRPKPELAGEEAALQGPRVWTDRGSGLAGAKVNGIAVNPYEEKIMYCTTDGGVFKSTDAGAAWKESKDGLVGLLVGRIAINPNNADILYLAPAYIDNAAGIQKTTDAGKNWTQVNKGLGTLTVMWVEIDQDNPNTLYAVTWGQGAYRTDDSGANWYQYSEGLPSTDGYCIVAGKEEPKVLFAGMSGAGLFKFDSSMDKWVESGKGITSSNIWHVAQDPFDGKTWLAGTPGGGLFKSTDSGKTWRQVTKGLTVTTIYRIVYHPRKSGVVYLGSKGTAGTGGGGVFRSVDGGETWAPDNQGLPALDIQDILITSRGLVYAATSTGLFYKQD